ncbi:MAG: pre-peptidase C-terminal domain-containing protein [Gammaproteobacteria bacterium]|nr:pre-peptidase C-terminal domain-containing protein [Gammaproteobacteria bacterium]
MFALSHRTLNSLLFLLLASISSFAFAEDLYEENDTRFTAFDLTLDEGTWLDTINGLGESFDEDYYQIEVTSGFQRVLVDLTFTHGINSDLDIFLLDSTGSVVASAISINDDEHIDVTVASGGIYYIRVFGAGGVYSGTSYNLWWDDIDPTLTDDVYETNNNRSTAYNLTSLPGTTITGISNDFDYYRIDVSANTRVLATLNNFSHSAGDLGLQLYDAAENTLVFSNRQHDDENIDYTVPSFGTYYLLVYNNDGYTGQSYNLVWNTGLSSGDDSYEDNDNFSSTTTPTLTEFPKLIFTSNDADWYEIDVRSGFTRLEIEVEHTHAEGNLGVELYNSLGDSIIFSNGNQDDELIVTDVVVAGTYYIAVYNNDTYTGQTYTLRWAGSASTSTSGDDAYEENDMPGEAISLPSDTLLNTIAGAGIANENDDDWYRISLSPGTTQVTVDLTFSQSSGDLDVELYDASGTTLLGGAYSVDDNENLVLDVSDSGVYYIRVYAYSGTGVTYDLQWRSDVDDGNVNTGNTTGGNVKSGGSGGSSGGGGGGGGSLDHGILLMLAMLALVRRRLRH